MCVRRFTFLGKGFVAAVLILQFSGVIEFLRKPVRLVCLNRGCCRVT